MAPTSSGTLVKTPRRSRSAVMSRKNLSTIFSHDAEVGEVHFESRMLRQLFLHGRMFVRGVVTGDQLLEGAGGGQLRAV